MVIPSSGSRQKNVGFYNKDTSLWSAVGLEFGSCIDSTGTATTNKPTIASIKQPATASSAIGYQAIVTKGAAGTQLVAGRYICELKAGDYGTGTDMDPTKTIIAQIGVIIED
jgi:hypothetical protein